MDKCYECGEEAVPRTTRTCNACGTCNNDILAACPGHYAWKGWDKKPPEKKVEADKQAEGRKLLQEFETMRLKAYSNVSLKRPLSEGEYKEMMAIAKELGFPVGVKL